MKKQELILYKIQNGKYRSVIKTKHGRLIYLEIRKCNSTVSVIELIYIDRMRCGKYDRVPEKFVTRDFNYNEILDVIASELDRRYFGVEIDDKFADLNRDEFIDLQLKICKENINFSYL